jgi:hypothetical protein
MRRQVVSGLPLPAYWDVWAEGPKRRLVRDDGGTERRAFEEGDGWVVARLGVSDGKPGIV